MHRLVYTLVALQNRTCTHHCHDTANARAPCGACNKIQVSANAKLPARTPRGFSPRYLVTINHSHRSHHRSTPAYPFQQFPPRLALDRLGFPLRIDTATRHAMIACADIAISNNATVLSITVRCKPGRKLELEI